MTDSLRFYDIYTISYIVNGITKEIGVLYFDRNKAPIPENKDTKIFSLRGKCDTLKCDDICVRFLGATHVNLVDHNPLHSISTYVNCSLRIKDNDILDLYYKDITFSDPCFADHWLKEPTNQVYPPELEPDDVSFPENKWHDRFMEIAKMVAKWSKDPSSKVGAVLVRDKRVIATGYNGWPSSMDDNLYLSQWESNQEYARSLKNKYSIHAERNAIEYAIGDVKGSTLYITHPPCISCTDYLIEKGIACVVVLDTNDERFLSVWNCKESFDKLAAEFIPVIKVNGE